MGSVPGCTDGLEVIRNFSIYGKQTHSYTTVVQVKRRILIFEKWCSGKKKKNF